MGVDNFCVIHVSLVPVLGVVGEQKTKPTQHSVQVLRSLGMTPNLLACRSTEPLEKSVRAKLVQPTTPPSPPLPPGAACLHDPQHLCLAAVA